MAAVAHESAHGTGGGKPTLYGIVAEFLSPEEILDAAERAREAGYTRLDAYTPFPVHGLDDAIKFFDPRIKWMIFFAGLFGGAAGLAFIYFTAVIDYPLNVGGRPLFSWPSFVPVTFECTILFASLTAFFGMLALNGLPKPFHPIFDAERFELASQTSFFLCVESQDPMFDPGKTKDFLQSLGAHNVCEVAEPKEDY
ncbi:MAG TPA: DUF3341 domain-containing protein [Fimbriimonadaceae bacterium]|nr:DUF3341 domain-containing protein [Fimbriimonadaceae bacterium]HRJ95206.1 DUF3341 domain-containing protein [Fimbriimonadaceae bacterium]